MNSRVSEIVVEQWRPPELVPAKPGGAWRTRKVLIWTGILLFHAFLIWRLAVWSPWREPRTAANAPVFADLMVGEVTFESGARSNPAPLSQVELPVAEAELPLPPADAW